MDTPGSSAYIAEVIKRASAVSGALFAATAFAGTAWAHAENGTAPVVQVSSGVPAAPSAQAPTVIEAGAPAQSEPTPAVQAFAPLSATQATSLAMSLGPSLGMTGPMMGIYIPMMALQGTTSMVGSSAVAISCSMAGDTWYGADQACIPASASKDAKTGTTTTSSSSKGAGGDTGKTDTGTGTGKDAGSADSSKGTVEHTNAIDHSSTDVTHSVQNPVSVGAHDGTAAASAANPDATSASDAAGHTSAGDLAGHTPAVDVADHAQAAETLTTTDVTHNLDVALHPDAATALDASGLAEATTAHTDAVSSAIDPSIVDPSHVTETVASVIDPSIVDPSHVADLGSTAAEAAGVAAGDFGSVGAELGSVGTQVGVETTHNVVETIITALANAF